jgi:dihydrofolate reductase
MTSSIIVAISANHAIGKNNQLLWHLPNDLKYFKNTTWGMPVIMGRKTFESVNRPLPGRINIVISRQPNWQAENVLTAASLADAIEKAASTHCKEVFIIGGGEIYKEAIGFCQCMYITRVHATLHGDTFFPEFDETQWQLERKDDFFKDEKHLYDYSFEKWVRKTATNG